MSGDSKYVQVFAAIAAGMDIPSIVETYDWITWLDVQQAAKRALLLEMSSNTRPKLRTDSDPPRAYEKWTKDEEQQLIALFDSGASYSEMISELGRGRGAITSRLSRLGKLIPDESGGTSALSAPPR